MNRRICVFCASSDAVAGVYFDAARELGAALARRGDTLVYGGGRIGLMGALAGACQGAGGRVVGVVPEALRDRELALDSCDELIVTRNMHDRKATMAERAEAFIALPGGFGTLEEITEVVTHRMLRFHRKPCVILNLNHFYDGLIEQFERTFRERFAPESVRADYAVAETIDQALEYAELD